MYDSTFMRVRIGGTLSDRFEYERGVRQVCPTSPILFNLYINDLMDKMERVQVPGLVKGLPGLLFADDTVLIADSKEDLNSKIKLVNVWIEKNYMEINPSKCGMMVVDRKEGPVVPESPEELTIKHKDEVILLVNKYVYLGLKLTTS